MTVQIKLNGQEVISGEKGIDIVNQMALLQWPTDKEQTTADYMMGVAKRARHQHALSVRWCCADHFLEDLIKSELVKVL